MSTPQLVHQLVDQLAEAGDLLSTLEPPHRARVGRAARRVADLAGAGVDTAPPREDAVGVVQVRVVAPPPGVAMLACRCGRVLDAAQMRRAHPPGRRAGRGVGHGAVVRRIVCQTCARQSC